MVDFSQEAPALPSVQEQTASNAPRVYNILLLGPTQSGKSSFLESVKKYADPTYQVDDSVIGLGVSSCTQDVREELVTTTLPVYKVYNRNDNVEFDLSRFLREKSEREFKKLLVWDDDLELRSEQVPDSSPVQFRFFDTPGLDDTNGHDILNIAKTFSALNRTKEFHLILILGSYAMPLLPSQKDAYKAYFQLLEELRGIITIVHTRVPFIDRHPDNMEFGPGLLERSRFFDEVMGRKVPAKRIDCNFKETGPVHNFLTKETVREVLVAAKESKSIFIDRTYVHKTRMMAHVDKIVHRRCKSRLDQAKIRGELDEFRINEEIEGINVQIEEKEQQIHQHNTDDLVVVYEKKVKEEWSLFRWPKEIMLEYPEHDWTIDNVTFLDNQSIELLEQSGGMGEKRWEVRFKRHFFQDGRFHVVLSVTSRKRYHKEIESWRGELETLKKLLEKLTYELSVRTKEMKVMQVVYSGMVEQTLADRLQLDTFMELANAGIYQGSDIEECAERLEGFLMEKAGLSVEG
ncbi:hypothetical protein B0O80DRAFT_428839 [Mortierella sp. GBAus27b]|nr:hypothetical protein BGX31_010675 [Mortierella sp. GBA43]KAI8349814.1 hypothetical protein B0O80DRAFT_428839 [Mortierella sp. GBAus27b]